MNIRFYMFGVPDGFDIYQEMPNSEIKNYFQCFYDETIKESTRLAVHRKPNGDVSYTYLKYHLFSEGNRPNSFIGLSVVFSAGYYADVASLYNLLEHAYNGALNKGVILRPTKNKESAVFQTKRFEFEASEVKRIESLVLNTLSSEEYASEFMTWDNGFSSGKQNALLKIPFQIYDDDPDKEYELNKFIGQRLKEYSWLSLSPDYIVKASHSPSSTKGKTITEAECVETLDDNTKKEYNDKFLENQSTLLNLALVDAITHEQKNELDGLYHDVKTKLSNIKQYAKDDDLKGLLNKYIELFKQTDLLLKKWSHKTVKSDSQSSSTPISSENNEGNSSFNETQNEDDSKQKGGKWKWISVAGGALLLVACYACFLHPHIFDGELVPNGTDTTSTQSALEVPSLEVESEIEEKPNLEELVAQFNKSIQESKFYDASGLYKQVVEVDESKTRELDKALEDRFKALIASCKFNLANKMLKDCLCNVYENVTLNEKELKDAFRSHIKANKNDINQKSELIQQINSAKQNDYGYDGIDKDLKFISALTAAPQQKKYSLLVYENAGNTPQTYSSNDTIMLDVNVLYRIRVSDFVVGAKLLINQDQNDRYQAWHGNSNDLFYNKYKDHMVLLKSERDEGYTEFDYMKDNNVLCKIKVKFVNSSSLSSRGFRRL